MSRVVSKNLFCYQLNGVLSDGAIRSEEQEKKSYETNPEMASLKQLVDSDDPNVDPEVVVKYLRISIPMFNDCLQNMYKDKIELCIHTKMEVPLRDGNDFAVPVLVHTPKHLVNERSNPAWIYAHGGGVVALDAESVKGELSGMATENDIVCFNVNYRLAPETKCPKNALDFYCAVKHIIENADDLGIDVSRIAIAGDSGGGYICFAVMVMLAQKDEGHLVKLAVPGIPMISDYGFSDVTSMTDEEQEMAQCQRKLWRCIANDFDVDKENPLLFPAKASNDILAKMPPTIIWEFEFDFLITEATRMANRMRKAGRLLEFRVQPGEFHYSAYIPGTTGYEMNKEDLKLAIKEYLL